MAQVAPEPVSDQHEKPKEEPQPLPYTDVTEQPAEEDITPRGSWLAEVLGEHNKAVIAGRPAVAVLLDGESKQPNLEDVEVCINAAVSFFDSPRRLLVLRVQCGSKTAKDVPSVQLRNLKSSVQDAFGRRFDQTGSLKGDAFEEKVPVPKDGPFLWPLHGAKVVHTIAMLQTFVLFGNSIDLDGRKKVGLAQVPFWKRVLIFLRIIPPPNDGPLIKVLQDHYGPSTAYMFSRSSFFTRMLWILAIWALLFSFVSNPSEGDKESFARISWMVSLLFLFGWGILVIALGSNFSSILITRNKLYQNKEVQEEWAARNPDFKNLTAHQKWKKLLLCGFPLIASFVALVLVVLFSFSQLIIYLTYIWGDCLIRQCRDPQDLHGWVGWQAEVGTDIAMAIIFEIFHALGGTVAQQIAHMRDREQLQQLHFDLEMLTVLLASIERIGTFGIIAFFFVPQWEDPVAGEDWAPDADCSDLILGDSSLWCIQRRIPLQARRQVFQKAFKGPFVVAPFVGIIVKVLIPFVANKWDTVANRCKCCCSVMDCFCDGIPHILGLIFFYDGPHIGCFKYVCKGWPFQVSEGKGEFTVLADDPAKPSGGASGGATDSVATGDDAEDFGCARDEQERTDMIKHALSQGVRKPWEPLCELLEVKMSFLWIMFFAPIMPSGVLPTLFARIVENHTDLIKMLFVRRRVFPEPNMVMHFTQTTFNRATVCGSLGWYAGLCLMTYNDDLFKWSYSVQWVVFSLILLWLFCSLLMLMRRFGSAD